MIILQRIWPLLLIAIVALLGNFIFYLVGLALLNPETTQVLIQLAPFLLMFGSVWIYGERLGPIELSGAAILFVGFGLFFNEKLVLLFGQLSGYTLGVVAMLAAATSWTVYGLLQKVLLRRMGSLPLTLLIYAGGALALWPFSAPMAVLDLNWVQLLALLFCGANMVLGYGAFTEAVRVGQAAKVGAVIALAPQLLFGSGFRLPTAAFGGLRLLVVAGSMLAALGRAR